MDELRMALNEAALYVHEYGELVQEVAAEFVAARDVVHVINAPVEVTDRGMFDLVTHNLGTSSPRWMLSGS